MKLIVGKMYRGRVFPGKVIIYERCGQTGFAKRKQWDDGERCELGVVVAEFYGIHAIENANAFLLATDDHRPALRLVTVDDQ